MVALAGDGLARAELSPDEFNEVRNAALTWGSGLYFSGTTRIDDIWFYTFRLKATGMFVLVPMSVTTFEEARQAILASMATFMICEEKWKKPLDQFINREIPLPPPGFTIVE